MDCKEILMSSSLFSRTTTSSDASFSCGRRAPFASSVYNLVPITASSHLKSRVSRRILSPAEKEAGARALTIERKFAENADNEVKSMCGEGHLKEAVEYFELLHKGSLRLNPKSYAFLLQECAKLRALDEGKKVHALLLTSDIDIDVHLRNHLLSLYVKCGCLKEAKLMFQAMDSARDVVSWTLMINACAEYGQFHEAIKHYHAMCKRRVRPNKITYVCLLKLCTQTQHLPTGKLIHEHIIKRCLDGDPYVGGALVDMYFRFGDVKEARKAFYAITKTNAYLWNRLVVGLVESRKNEDALKVYRHMRYRHCVEPTEATWVHVIKACGYRGYLDEGRFAHFCLCRDGIAVNGSIGQELVQMYIACGSLVDARQVFDKLHLKPPLLWTCLIEEYEEQEKHEEAARLRCQMQEHEKLTESGQLNGITVVEESSSEEMLDHEEFLVDSLEDDCVDEN